MSKIARKSASRAAAGRSSGSESKQPEILYVPRWLVAGAYPSAGALPSLADGVPNEARLHPMAGMQTSGRTWQIVNENPVNFLDPRLGFKQTEQCYAYAFTYVHVPEAEKVDLLAGSDDGIAIWLNGTQVHCNDTWRGVVLDNDVVPVTLRRGWNALLVKISQGGGDWGFVFRIKRGQRTGKISFTLDRAAARQGGKSDNEGPPLSVIPTVSQFPLCVRNGELLLTQDLLVVNDTAKPAKGLKLCVLAKPGKTLATETLAGSLAAFACQQHQLQLPVEALFSAVAEGSAVTVEAESSVGRCAAVLPSEAWLRMLLEVMGGFSLSKVGGPFTVPDLMRGQVARLEVRSQREVSVAGQTVAARPLCSARDYAASATRTGSIDLDLTVAKEIADPVAKLLFGGHETQQLLCRIRFVLDDLRADTAPAAKAVLAGLRAVAQSDFPGAVKALRGILDALVSTLPDCSHQQITLVGHAHIDMNWLWNMSETCQVTHDTFRQVLSFMDEFPDFTFSQSQSSTYKFMEELDPQLFKRVQQRVKEGRWELLGGMVDEGDTNLSGGEALARSFLLGQRYFLSRFNKQACVGWLPDNFGHIAQLPQLLKLSGISAFYGHRCMPQFGPFLWEGVDGSRVTNYVTPTYNGEVTPRLRDLPGQYDPKHGKLLWVYGVGDHGGGPTRRDITRAKFYQTIPRLPKIKFGTATEFFKSLESDRKDYRVVKGELQYIFEGCYTSIARIKEGNRRCENALFATELLAAFASKMGYAYPRQPLYDAWETVAFNQFHDILCGSAVHESNRGSVAAYDEALEKTAAAQYGVLRYLAERVPTATGRGQPLVVFNPQPVPRTDWVEAELFTYQLPPSVQTNNWGMGGPPDATMKNIPMRTLETSPSGMPTLILNDADGRPVMAQIVNAKVFPNGHRLKVRFLAKEMPACGVRLFYARPDQDGPAITPAVTVKDTIVDTPFFTVQVDPKTGHLTRLFDKRRNCEVLSRGVAANQLKVYMEKPHGMTAWNIGPIANVHNLDSAELVRVTERGPVRSCIEVWRRWNRSLFVQRTYVYADLPRIEFELEAHWFEHGSATGESPMLRVAFPLNVKNGVFTCETPYAALERPTTGQEVPVQRWLDLANPETGGAALLNDGKYGHRCMGNVLETTLLRASYDPDPYPDQGPHFIRYALVPHVGSWQNAGIDNAGQAFNLPLIALETPPGQSDKKALPVGGFLTLTPANVQISAVKLAEDKPGLIIRFCEMQGRAVTAELTLAQDCRSASRVDLIEHPLPKAAKPKIKGKTIRVAVQPHEIVTLFVTTG